SWWGRWGSPRTPACRSRSPGFEAPAQGMRRLSSCGVVLTPIGMTTTDAVDPTPATPAYAPRDGVQRRSEEPGALDAVERLGVGEAVAVSGLQLVWQLPAGA